MKKITAETAIGLLVDNDINTIVNDNLNSNDNSYINDIMRIGFKGYDNFTLEELQSEYDAALVETEKGYPAIIIKD